MTKPKKEEKMVFVIYVYGDRDVGLDPVCESVIMPNPGFDDEEWIEQCTKVLEELYLSDQKGYVKLKSEFDKEMDDL